MVAAVICGQNKARRRVIASYGEEPQRSAARKAPRYNDLPYWNRHLVVPLVIQPLSIADKNLCTPILYRRSGESNEHGK